MYKSEGNNNASEKMKLTITRIWEAFFNGSFSIMAAVTILGCCEFLHLNQHLYGCRGSGGNIVDLFLWKIIID